MSFAFSWNIVSDLQQMWSLSFMRQAFEAGTMVAVIAGVMGYFVVLRRSTFVAHAFSEIGFAGASGALYLAQAFNMPWLTATYGMLLGSSLGGTSIAMLSRRSSHRDVYVGIVLAFALGIGLLFLSLYTGYATAGISLLFGEILAVSADDVTRTLVFTILILAGVGLIYRPLLFASLDEEVAEAKGLPTLFLGVAFLLLVAVAVSVAVQVTGVLLIFSLMVTPAATAQHLASKPGHVMVISAVLALIATWVGLFVSFYQRFPASFFITAIIFAVYILVRIFHHRIRAQGEHRKGWKDRVLVSTKDYSS